MTDLPTFQDVWCGLSTQEKDSLNILLGNGFSIGAYEGFRYENLLKEAKDRGVIPDRVQACFERYGTNNFEKVLNQLSEAEWLADLYGWNKTTIQKDQEDVKKALIAAIAAVHPGNQADTPESLMVQSGEILSRFRLIATVNYDLILYWTVMAYMDDTGKRFHFKDGFRPLDQYGNILAFHQVRPKEDGTMQKRVICYLHGAIHLTRSNGMIVKRQWGVHGRSLTQQARDAIDNDDLPLFVAEGSSKNKKTQIMNDGYLAWALGQIELMSGVLFTYGWSAGDQDQHILEAIHANEKLKTIYVGVYDESTLTDRLALQSRAKKLLEMPRELRVFGNNHLAPLIEVEFYDAKSLPFWVDPGDLPFE